MLGTAASLLLTALLALIFTKATHLTGFSSEEAHVPRHSPGRTCRCEGLLLAGMVIGALGVLDDVTVSQASTVLALRSANPRCASGSCSRSPSGSGATTSAPR